MKMYEMYFAVSEDKCYEIGDMFEVGKRLNGCLLYYFEMRDEFVFLHFAKML